MNDRERRNHMWWAAVGLALSQANSERDAQLRLTAGSSTSATAGAAHSADSESPETTSTSTTDTPA